MPKVRSIEFWLVALPVLVILAAWGAGFKHEFVMGYFIPVFAAVWMVLAIAWLLREFVRKFRD